MGIGFYLMIAAAIIMYGIAEVDRRRGWLWGGMTLCLIMLLGKIFGLGTSGVFVGFFLAFLAMFVANMRSR